MSSQAQLPPFRPEVLVAEMRRQFLSDEALARRAGVATRSIARWRRGENQPHGSNVRSLAEALGREPGDFFEAAA